MVQVEKPENETHFNKRRAVGRRSQIRRSVSIRTMTHLSLGGMTATLLLLVAVFVPAAKQVGFLVVTLGYSSLFLICVTLLIGPLNLLRVRRNPVNLDLRRDIGIWAAITGCWHVLLVLRGIIPAGQALGYFLLKVHDSYAQKREDGEVARICMVISTVNPNMCGIDGQMYLE